MFCKHCGKLVDDNSVFCEFCGGKITADNGGASEKSEIKPKQQSVWDKFTDIYDSRDKVRDSYISMTAVETWDIIGKIPKNSCEDFLNEHKDELNKQP